MKYNIIILVSFILGSQGNNICNTMDSWLPGLGGVGMALIVLTLCAFAATLYCDWRTFAEEFDRFDNYNNNE